MTHKPTGHVRVQNGTPASTVSHFSLAYFLCIGIQVTTVTRNRGYNCLITCLYYHLAILKMPLPPSFQLLQCSSCMGGMDKRTAAVQMQHYLAIATS